MRVLDIHVTNTPLFLVVIAMLATSCGGGIGGEKTVRGRVTEVQAWSITEVAAVTVEEMETGKVWMFETEGPIGFTPSHLREHMLQGQLVTVHYQELQGKLIAVLVKD